MDIFEGFQILDPLGVWVSVGKKGQPGQGCVIEQQQTICQEGQKQKERIEEQEPTEENRKRQTYHGHEAEGRPGSWTRRTQRE